MEARYLDLHIGARLGPAFAGDAEVHAVPPPELQRLPIPLRGLGVGPRHMKRRASWIVDAGPFVPSGMGRPFDSKHATKMQCLGLMEEAGWVPVAVDPLVPPARLAALMVERRSERGLDVVDMARLSNGAFSVSYLQDAERGRIELDEQIVSNLVGLYQLHAGPVVPERHELIIDIDRQEISVGGRSVEFDSLHSSDVLTRYVSLLCALRAQDAGSSLTLRYGDLEVLSECLGRSHEDLRTEIGQLIAAPESVTNAKQVSRAQIVLGAGLLVGITALGTLVLVGGRADPGPPEVLGAQQTTLVAPATSSFAADIGAQAEALISYDFRSELPDWQITFEDENADYLGVTLSEIKTISIYVQPDSTVESVAGVLMHEVGHALDIERLNDLERAEWIELRDMPSTWWPGNGLSDFAVGAGDFAEAVAALTVGSPSSSVYGEFTEEQLAFVAEVLHSS